MTHHQLRIADKRSGMAILLVLIFLMVITTIIGAMLRYLVLNNRQTKQRMHSVQALWLAESGVERAVFSLRQNPSYREETWRAAAAAFAGRTGQVEISVETKPEDSTHVTVNVLATFPTDSAFSAKARREVIVKVPEIKPAAPRSPNDETDRDEIDRDQADQNAQDRGEQDERE